MMQQFIPINKSPIKVLKKKFNADFLGFMLHQNP